MYSTPKEKNYKYLIKMYCVTALAKNNKLRQITALNGRQLQSRDLKIVYNSEQRRHSFLFLSLALDFCL